MLIGKEMQSRLSHILMHKDIPVAEIRLDSVTASVSAFGELFAPAHMPVGIPIRKGEDCLCRTE